MNACFSSLQPCSSTSAWISSRSARQRSTGPSRPNSSWKRTARSKATQAITFECVKCRAGPRTSQMPASSCRQPVLEPLEELPDQRPGVVVRRHALRARLVERVQHLAVDVELELLGGGVADPHGPRPGEAREPVELALVEAALAGDART